MLALRNYYYFSAAEWRKGDSLPGGLRPDRKSPLPPFDAPATGGNRLSFAE